jgi:hypothetical protein
MALSIKRFFAIAADVPIASSAVLQTVGLTSPIAVNEKQKIDVWVPITVGATGGVRSLVAVPAGGTVLHVSTILYNTGAGTVIPFSASTVFTNALANAGTHWLKIEATVQNGATAGNIDVQIAQNTSDVLTLTVLNGGNLSVDVYS